MKSANLAIVFTDIQGFTERTSRQTREENQRLLATHDALLRPIFTGFGGRIVKSIGDAFLVTFESPTQAVLAGVAIQDRLWLHNRDLREDEQLRVRVAVNVGEVRVESGDVFGEPVNIAARVEGITDPGEVFFTEAVYLSMNKAEVPAEEVGPFELKGIPGKIKVFRVPHAPYRVAPAEGSVPKPVVVPIDGAQPPFGNMGLSRLPEGGRATQALSQATMAIRRRKVQPKLLVGGAAALLLIVALITLLGGSEVERAISAAGEASAQQRPQRIKEAEALIAQLKSEPERALRRAQLTLAIGRGEEAARRFTDAAQAGSDDALSELIDLLEHPKCEVRSEAARGLGQLKAKEARRPLERLAERGGTGDPKEGNKALLGGIFGCDSKDAASRALERLE